MAHSAGAAAHHHGHHHIVPRKTLFIIFGVLLFLTALTVATATQLDLGWFNVPLALIIAATKATLVVMFFMALKWDIAVNRLAAVTGIIFVAIFMTFTMFDTLFRGDVGNVDRQTIMDIQRQEKELRALEPQGNLSGQPAAGAATTPLSGAGQDSTGAAGQEGSVTGSPDTSQGAAPLPGSPPAQ